MAADHEESSRNAQANRSCCTASRSLESSSEQAVSSATGRHPPDKRPLHRWRSIALAQRSSLCCTLISSSSLWSSLRLCQAVTLKRVGCQRETLAKVLSGRFVLHAASRGDSRATLTRPKDLGRSRLLEAPPAPPQDYTSFFLVSMVTGSQRWAASHGRATLMV